MEKSKIKVQEYSKRTENYGLFVALSLLCLFVELLLRNTLLRKLP